MAIEHVFAPRNVALGNLPYNSPGTTFTGSPDGAKWKDFLRGDMPAVTGINRIVDDGLGNHVWECNLLPNQGRNEAWRGDNAEQGVYFPGQTMACCLAFKLADDFPVPPGFSVFWQIHTPYDYVTRAPSYAYPMTLISGEGGELRVQNNSEGGIDYRTGYDRGRWHYWIFEVIFGRSDTPRKGHLTVWHQLDKLPLITDTPVVNKDRNTAMPNHSTATGEYTKSGMYMAPNGGTYRMWRDAYAQAGSASRARELMAGVCRPQALQTQPPPPPPGPTNLELVAAAKAELEQTTISGKKWVAGGRGAGHWRNAYQLLDQIKDC